MGKEEKISSQFTDFTLARRPTYLKVNLDVILDNLKILKSHLAQHTGKCFILSIFNSIYPLVLVLV